MSFTREELIEVASRIYASREYKNKPIDLDSTIEESIDLLEAIERTMAQRNRKRSS